MEPGLIFALAGAAIVMAISGTGSAIGVAFAGQAAGGVLSEDPEKFGRMIPLIGIPGTQGFYGFLVGFLVLNKLNLLADAIKIPTLAQGLQIFAICTLVSIVEAISAVWQGKVAVSSIYLVAKRPEQAGRALVLPIFVEIYAILGLAAGFLLLLAVKI
ncbi:MAG: V-type ATP synthase subunit K [Candidatus Omnitrophica bacterium]|nr:V-type ATP synthase subunit K [Candidatus Omnitrophota bacterium]HOX54081.1 V-type ATP synthase subunit K [Candidatus Omnitrophota bacterium]